MRLRTVVARGLVLVLLAVAGAPVSALLGGSAGVSDAYAQSGQTIRNIRVEGNRRVEPETVRSYLLFGPGDVYNPERVDESLKALFATGLFQDVRIRRQGGTVIVIVEENPVINQVAFEGNSEIDDDELRAEVQLKPRSIYTRARVQSDVQRIVDVYRRQGRFAARVDPKIIKLPHNRVDLVFEIYEGGKTTVKGINFVGNQDFSDSTLRDVITTTETGWFSFLKPTNIYDPDRLRLDRELIRQFYLKNGYADIQVLSAYADLDREGQGFFITFTLEEGREYRFGAIDIESSIPELDIEDLRSVVTTKAGKIYDAQKIEKSIEHLTVEASQLGFAFARVRPRAQKDVLNETISITYVIDQGPRIYIERIDIVGNTRTLDSVIRREFVLVEGDAYNKVLVDAARRRLRGLGFFKKVEILTQPGSSPDRIILVVQVIEQPTGELSFGAGYSTHEGVVGDISLSERNLLGRGQFVRLALSGSIQRFQIDFGFTEPRFLGRNMSAGFDLFHRETDLTDESSFRSRKTGGGLRLGVPLNDDWAFLTRYTFTREEIFDVSPTASEAIINSQGVTNVSAVGYTLVYDTRNLRKNPTRGLYFTFNQDLAGLGGDVNYLRSIAEGRGYYPIWKKVIFVGRLQAGNVEGYDGEDVRLQDVFFKGGESVRGFDRAGYGPRDLVTGDALGGKVFATANAEIRYPFPFVPEELGLTGAFFADAGTLFNPGDLGIITTGIIANSKSIRSSVGVSLIWESPLGPFRADLAQVLSSESFDKEEVFRFGASTSF
jgi:outer membrane protein insertion porin family